MSSLKHILFIIPNIENFWSHDATESLVFAMLKALTLGAINTSLYDDVLKILSSF